MEQDDLELRHPEDFRAGREAARAGASVRTNPVKGDDERRLAWSRGWNRERQEVILTERTSVPVTVADVRDYLRTFPDQAIVKRSKMDHVEPGAAVCLDVLMDHLEVRPRCSSV